MILLLIDFSLWLMGSWREGWWIALTIRCVLEFDLNTRSFNLLSFAWCSPETSPPASDERWESCWWIRLTEHVFTRGLHKLVRDDHFWFRRSIGLSHCDWTSVWITAVILAEDTIIRDTQLTLSIVKFYLGNKVLQKLNTNYCIQGNLRRAAILPALPSMVQRLFVMASLGL